MLFLLPAGVLYASLAYYHYRTALLLLVVLLPTYLLRFTVVGLPTNFFEAALAVVVLAGLAQPTVRRSWRQAWHDLPPTLLLFTIIFVIAAIISVVISPHPRTSLGILKGWILAPAFFGYLIYADADKRPQQRYLAALLISTSLMALLGLAQLHALDRVQGVYDVPASLALFLTPIATIAWWRGPKLIAVLLVAAIIATQSLAALFALLAALTVGCWLWPAINKRRVVVALCLLAALAGGYLTFTGRLAYLTQPLTGHQPNSISVRLQLWSVALDLIQESPVFGIGLGQFEPAYQQKLHERFAAYEAARLRQLADGGRQLAQPIGEFVYRDPHNWLLSFWLNTGLLGLISFIGLHYAVVLQAKPAQSRETQALLLALLSIFIHGLAETVFWKNDLAALHFVLLALVLKQRWIDRGNNQPSQ